MRLLTKQVLEHLPKLYETEGEIDPIVQTKFFLTGSNYTWYVIEYDSKDIFYGYVVGDCPELGYFSLQELQGIRNRFGLGVERDLYFKPTSLKKIMQLTNGKGN